MTTKRKIRRGSSKAGRPRKEGERYPNGQLKPTRDLGNTKVRDWRAAMLGGDQNLERADNPVSLALARGWISEGQARAAEEFARRYRRWARWYGPPKMGSGSPREVDLGAGVDKRSLQDMTDSEKAAVFDAVFNATHSQPDTAADVQEAWQAVNRPMTAEERAEVFLVAVQQSWPQWLLQRCAGRFDTSWERKRDLLVRGLEAVALAVRPPREEKARTLSLGDLAMAKAVAAKGRGRLREEVTTYTDQDGEFLYEVVRKTRGAA